MVQLGAWHLLASMSRENAKTLDAQLLRNSLYPKLDSDLGLLDPKSLAQYAPQKWMLLLVPWPDARGCLRGSSLTGLSWLSRGEKWETSTIASKRRGTW